MKLKKQLVANAWRNLIDTTPNKFWGFIVILQNIKAEKDTIVPQRTYQVEASEVAGKLDNLFYFGDLVFASKSTPLYITFSNHWVEKIRDVFKTSSSKGGGRLPYIKDIVTFYYSHESFDKPISLFELINKFMASLKVSDAAIRQIIDLDVSDETLELEEDYPNDELLQELSKVINTQLAPGTLSFDKSKGYTNIKAPNELTAGPFTQPLYASQSVLSSFVLSNFDFGSYYFDASIEPTTKPVELSSSVNTIFYGPPGTGKTREIQKCYLDGKTKEQKEFVTFHQSYTYEEFIEGIKPEISFEDNDAVKGKEHNEGDLNYRYAEGIFFKACDNAAKLAGFKNLEECINAPKESRQEAFKQALEAGLTFNFCIDEINRANIAAVFGDLIALIEPSKRLGAEEELTVTLPYSKRDFGVPGNLLIIGSMNTADRSITLMDTALRRRFAFREIAPDHTTLAHISIEGISVSSILERINQRIRYFLGKDLCIGHAYFLGLDRLKNPGKPDLMKVFVNKIIPLLEEYFYNDYVKIGQVLGDNNKAVSDWPFYVSDVEMSVQRLFKSSAEDIEDKTSFRINPLILRSIEENAVEIPISCFEKIYN